MSLRGFLARVAFIKGHALCDRFDRVCLINSEHLFDRLVAQVEQWVTRQGGVD